MIRKHKKRYIGFRVTSRPIPTKQQLLYLLLRKLHITPQPRIRIIECHVHTGIGILLCSHTLLPHLRQVIQQTTETPDKSPSIQLLGVSGTIKSLRRKFLTTKQEPHVQIRKSF